VKKRSSPRRQERFFSGRDQKPMKDKLKALVITLSLLNGGWLPVAPAAQPNSSYPLPVVQAAAAPTRARVNEALAQQPPHFEENRGQVAADVHFFAKTKRGQALLTSAGMTWQTRAAAVQMRLVKANPHAQAEGIDRLPGHVNYLRGHDRTRWQTNLPTYARVEYRDVYPGVNAVYYWKQQELEYDFVVAPGADVRRIKLAFTGARKLFIDARGDLVVRMAGGELRHHKPFAYQMVQGERREVPARFVQHSAREIGFAVADYDPRAELVIDPTLAYSGYLGGDDRDAAVGIAVDAAGNIYVAGTVNSLNFPVTPGAYQTTLKDIDAFVTKLNPAGTTVLYSTFLGGGQAEDATGLTVDAAGNVFVTGFTGSADFPTTPGAYQTTVSRSDAFVTKLNASGSGLIFSTLLGGSGNEFSYGIAADAANNVYVTGSTTSTNFPTTTGVFQGSPRGGGLDAFVTKLNASGTQLVYSSYLGGDGIDEGYGLAVDTAGNAYVTGSTTSTNFTTTPGVFQATYNGTTSQSDAFVTKVNAAGTALTYSTYLGGRSNDVASGIAIDAAGNAYVTGATTSSNQSNDFPTTAGALQTTFRGSSMTGSISDAFVSKLNATGTALAYSTYLGGNGADRAFGIAVNAQGTAFVTGSTSSSNFPVASDSFKLHAGGTDAFVTQLDAAGAALAYGTYLGGGRNDTGIGLALDAAGNVYAVGNTSSANFPVTRGAYQTTWGNGQDVFISVLRNGTSIVATTVTAASYSNIPIARESIVSAFGVRLATRTQESSDTDPGTPGIQLPTTLAGTTIRVKDDQGVERLAPLFYASPQQVNYQIPPGTPNGAALVTVMAEDGTTSIGTIQIVDVTPDMFSLDSTGRGAPAGYFVRAKAGGAPTEEPVAERTGPNTWVLKPIDLGPETDVVALVFFGTGIRFRKDPPQVSARIGGVDARVDYARNQCCFVGLDQVNLLIPRSLIGRGEVDVVVTIDSKATAPLKIAIK
jgi:uncharacterized protein (TIGR03437 family)